MALPEISEVGRLTADPALKFSPSGMAIADLAFAFNSRKFNRQTDQWEDGDVLYLRGAVFKETAEAVAESLTKGMEVLVKGKLRTRSWEDKEGAKHSTVDLMIDSVAPVVSGRQSVKVTKVERSGGGGYGASQDPGGFGGGGSQVPPKAAADPWSTGPSGGGHALKGGYSSDEPPF